MCLIKCFKRCKKRRRERIYEGPCEDGGTRISYDTAAPKEIVSDTLVKFSCKFSTLSLMDESIQLKRGVHSFIAERSEDGGSCTVSYICSTSEQKIQSQVRSVELLDGNYMKLLINSGGADSPRSVTLRKTGGGTWYLWEQNLLTDIRIPKSQDAWA